MQMRLLWRLQDLPAPMQIGKRLSLRTGSQWQPFSDLERKRGLFSGQFFQSLLPFLAHLLLDLEALGRFLAEEDPPRHED